MALLIGNAAIDRSNARPSGYTYIDTTNPANATGRITLVDIWYANEGVNATDVIVGIFYGAGTNYTCRDYVYIGAVTKGSKQTKLVDLAVQQGDFIGIYGNAGNIELDTTGGSGLYYLSGNSGFTSTQTYALYSGNTISVYGSSLNTRYTLIT